MDPSVKITHFSVEGPAKEVEEVYQRFLAHLPSFPIVTRTEVPTSKPPVPTKDLDYTEIVPLNRFVRKFYVKHYSNKTLVLAYYLVTQMSREVFYSGDIRRLYVQYGRRVPRFLHGTILRNINKGFLLKSGPNRGQEIGLILTDAGKRHVERQRRSRYWK